MSTPSDPRAVLTSAAAHLSPERARQLLAWADEEHPPKPEPVWRSNGKECDYAMIDGCLHMRETGREEVHKLFMRADLICGLAADYYAQQGVTVPEEAVKTASDAQYNAGRLGFRVRTPEDEIRAALTAALPSLLAANQPQQRKPKAVGWVTVEADGDGCRGGLPSFAEADAERVRYDRLYSSLGPHRVLALVELEEVQP